MSNIPDSLPVLSAGGHEGPHKGACVMEYVSLLAGESWSDRPACTHPVLAAMARQVNDHLPDSERSRLVPLIGRLFGTAPSGSEVEQRVLSVRLACWCARQVLDLASDRATALAAIEAAERWADEPSEEHAYAAYAYAYADASAYAAYAASAAASAAYAASAAASAADAAAYAAAYAASAAASAAYAASAAASAADAAAYAAAYAASAAAYAAAYAASAAASAALLSDLIDEYDRLTGRVEHRDVTPADYADLAAAVGR